MLRKIVRLISAFLKKWFWDKPTAEPEPYKATEVVHNYIVIDYKGQYINLKKSQIGMWNSLSRHDKRGMAQKFAVMEKKGLIRFETINGKLTCIKNKDYERKADDGKQHNGTPGSGK